MYFYGSKNGPEQQIAIDHKINFKNINPSQIRTRNPFKLFLGIINFYKSYIKAKKFLIDDNPEIVIITGGFTSAPVGWSAKKLKIPFIIYCPDIKPGWAIKSLIKHAKKIYCSVDESTQFFPKDKTIVTGYPLRKEFYSDSILKYNNQRQAIPVKTLLIMGGSLGSYEINEFTKQNLIFLLSQYKIIHICGKNDYQKLNRRKNQLNNETKRNYELYDFSNDISLLMAKSDLVFCRAGASILGELPATSLPAILYPGQFSDQIFNAQYLEKKGAAIIVKNINKHALDVINKLLTDTKKLEKMKEAMKLINPDNASNKIATLILEYINVQK
jgi:UDP-N-acetylglucosamine--N-acetylmuramyl-(pentapeptide) pyrophosphoryl-undecaprenol N-acetylglucosamine transferase